MNGISFCLRLKQKALPGHWPFLAEIALELRFEKIYIWYKAPRSARHADHSISLTQRYVSDILLVLGILGRSEGSRTKWNKVSSTLRQTLFRHLLQDAIVSSTNQKSNKRVKDEQEFYDYEVYSPVSSALLINIWLLLQLWTLQLSMVHAGRHCLESLTLGGMDLLQDVNFLVSVGLKAGKVFALFVKAPAKASSKQPHHYESYMYREGKRFCELSDSKIHCQAAICRCQQRSSLLVTTSHLLSSGMTETSACRLTRGTSCWSWALTPSYLQLLCRSSKLTRLHWEGSLRVSQFSRLCQHFWSFSALQTL